MPKVGRRTDIRRRLPSVAVTGLLLAACAGTDTASGRTIRPSADAAVGQARVRGADGTTAVGRARAARPPTKAQPPPELSPPIRAAFYWLDSTARKRRDGGRRIPSLDRAAGRRAQIRALRYAGFDAAIASWTRPGGVEDRRFGRLLATTRRMGSPLRWAINYRKEAAGDPSAARIAADLRRLARAHAGAPAYLRVGGKPVVFVSAASDDCSMAARWKAAAGDRFVVSLKIFTGFRTCAAQPAAWYQYSPELPRTAQRDLFFAISPGYRRAGEAPRLRRDLGRFRADVRAMVASNAPWQLVTSFNGWSEGSAVESGPGWTSRSGYGRFLDVIRRQITNSSPAPPEGQPVPAPEPAPAPAPEPGSPAPAPPLLPQPFPVDADAAVVMAAGDIACSPNDARYNGGRGTGSACMQAATSDLLVAQAPAAVLPLGDNQYGVGALSAFRTSYDPTWGRLKAISRPAVGNHEYLTPGAQGHFDYFNGEGVQNGPAGDRSMGYYSFDLGRWHLVAINSNCRFVRGCRAGSTQEKWLRADLEGHRDGCVLAYWHHPRYSSGLHESFANMAPIWQALYDAGAEVVLSGHDHDYERFAPQDASGNADAAFGIRQFVVGTGGGNLRAIDDRVPNSEVSDTNTFGVLKLTLRPDSYDWQFLPAAGGSFTDAGSGSCHAAP